MRPAKIIKFLIGMTAFLAASLNGETPEDTNAPASERLPFIDVEVQRSGNEVSAAFTIKVTIANTTAAPISLRKLTAIIPPELEPRSKPSGEENWREVGFNPPNLNPGQKVIKRIKVPGAPFYDFRILLFIASKLEAGAQLTYLVEDINQGPREIEAPIPVHWEGTLLGKFFGGLIGCSALAAFLSSRRIGGNKMSRKTWLGFGRAFLSTFALGMATVLAAILLLAFLAPGSLPITFSVEDWRGGAVLGLFSIPVGAWLLEKLSLTRLSDADEKAG